MESSTNAAQVKIDEDSWVIQIKECLDVMQEEEEGDKELSVSVFDVPKELLASKPEAYIPQMVSIGPYHHWRSELYDMERHKLVTACRFQKRMKGLAKFQSIVVEEFKKYDWQIRSCYHKFIDYKEETLAWIMALDAVFLLECLQFYVRHADQSSHKDVKPLGQVLDSTGASADHNSVFRDLMMLENQLPLFLMIKLLELQLGSKAKAEERLWSLLMLVSQEFSPFSFKLPEISNLRVNERGHMLEVLYYGLVPLSKNQNPIRFEQEKDVPYPADMSTVTPLIPPAEKEPAEKEPAEKEPAEKENDAADMSTVTEALSCVNVGPLRFLTEFLRRALNSKPGQFVMKLPYLLFLSLFKGLWALGERSSPEIIPPSRDELAIPSVADLCFAGVKFSPTDGDLTTIQFDQKTGTLYLPRIKLDTNTEVILRNLVAFEASAAPGEFVLRRYTDFMNGMIDGIEDVKLLRERGIICNHLQSDGEVASLWNSMGKCVRPRIVGDLEKVIKDLKRYHSRNWKVVVVEFVNNYIFSSWKFLSLVAAAILLIVSCLDACVRTALSIIALPEQSSRAANQVNCYYTIVL